MYTPTNRPTSEQYLPRGRPRRQATPRLEPVEARFLLAAGADLAHPFPAHSTPLLQPVDRDASPPADPPQPSTLEVDYDDALIPGEGPHKYKVSVGEADTFQFGLFSRAKTADFIANVAIYTGDGNLLTSGPLASSSVTRGTNLITIVGIPHGDAGSQPGLVSVDIPPTGLADAIHSYEIDANFNLRFDPDNPHSAPGASSVQPDPSPDGTGGWFLDMTPQASPLPAAGENTAIVNAVPSLSTSLQGPGTLPSTLPNLSSTDPDDPSYEIPLEPSRDLNPSPPAAASASSGPAHLVAPVPGEPHRPPPVDLDTPDAIASGFNGEVPLLADAATRTGGVAPVSWNAPIERPAHGLSLLACPIDWFDGEGTTRPGRQLGGLDPGSVGLPRQTATARTDDETRHEGDGRTLVNLVSEADPNDPSREDSETEPRLMPVLAGVGGSSALFAGLLFPDLSERISRRLRNRLGAGRRRSSFPSRRARLA